MNNEVFEWDDIIENDGADIVTLPEGDYDFEVIGYEKARHTPKEGGKLPPCPKAIVELRVDGGELGVSIIKHNLFLYKSTEGLLCAFFTAIGLRKKGEPLKMNWNAITGRKGRAKISVREWVYDGKEYTANDVKKFYEYTGDSSSETTQQPQNKTWSAGDF